MIFFLGKYSRMYEFHWLALRTEEGDDKGSGATCPEGPAENQERQMYLYHNLRVAMYL